MTIEQRDHIDNLALCCEDDVTIRIECSICGESYENHVSDTDEIPVAFHGDTAKEAYSDGWRYASSEVFGMIGPLCSSCVEHKDDFDYHAEETD
jgi:hypothetical protein